MERPWPPEVRVVDFGIRALDLAYALTDGYETVILIDAAPQGGPPGTVCVIEPDLDAPASREGNPGSWDPHRLATLEVLQQAKSACSTFPQLFLVACEPADLGGDAGRLGLSPRVQGALERAMTEVESLVAAISSQ
jgi:hydrogenase maturation protease